MLANRTAIASRPSTNRAAVTNNPLARADGRTPQGRRIRDLYRAWHAAMGQPTDPVVQAAILGAAELTVAAETARAALLGGTGDIDAVVRLENLAGRAVRKLNIRPSATPSPSLRDYVASRAGAASPEKQTPREGAEGPVGEKAHHAVQEKQGEAFEEDQSR
jgi:hypothetical protein